MFATAKSWNAAEQVSGSPQHISQIPAEKLFRMKPSMHSCEFAILRDVIFHSLGIPWNAALGFFTAGHPQVTRRSPAAGDCDDQCSVSHGFMTNSHWRLAPSWTRRRLALVTMCRAYYILY
eukprot:GHVU01231494.1.p1 GENE.GHVU01231494.1~~GHVU01231494.1.p1  ORF type:complete len:121 (-),score=1.31 GHVU01231494.1:347-709(-)